jgi:CubicO group peptidase (beta-lactamase class C family)
MRHILDSLASGVRASATGPGVTPGGVLVYGDQGQDVATMAFGRTHFEPQGTAAPVTARTIYDVASLTKPMATAAALMTLDIDLDRPVTPWLPELGVRGAERITLAQLLGHASGFPAHIEFFKRLRAGERAGAATAREALLRMVCATELEREPGQKAMYSDLGYIALGFVIERITGKTLDVAVRDLVTGPLGMEDTFYVDLHGAGLPADMLQRVAPTEVCPYRGLVHGQVHDDNAHAGGGVFGHAGLFATAGDVARFARTMIAVLNGRTVAGFAPDVIARFVTVSAAPDTTWRLGWDRPAPLPAVSHAGDLWPRHGLGHLGFTGCAMWLDPPRGRYVVLLTNRVHPSRDQPGILQFRRAVMDAVVRELDAR